MFRELVGMIRVELGYVLCLWKPPTKIVIICVFVCACVLVNVKYWDWEYVFLQAKRIFSVTWGECLRVKTWVYSSEWKKINVSLHVRQKYKNVCLHVCVCVWNITSDILNWCHALCLKKRYISENLAAAKQKRHSSDTSIIVKAWTC